MNARISEFLFVFFLFANIIASIYVFSNGFLIRRVALSRFSGDEDASAYQSIAKLKLVDKIIFILVDALRFDFVLSFDINDSQSRQKNEPGLPTIARLLRERSESTRLFKFIADAPTTTMQRIKALMTGTLPTFIDAGSNFNSYLIDDDSLIKQCHLNNKSTIVLGDDTWLSLFDENLLHEHHTYPSFDIKDLDTNDINVDLHLSRLLLNNSLKWNLVIAHYLGLDHAGHTYGARSNAMRRKLNDIDNTLK
jgi:GPI ethanolamine phosphate transferase 3 subunit O